MDLVLKRMQGFHVQCTSHDHLRCFVSTRVIRLVAYAASCTFQPSFVSSRPFPFPVHVLGVKCHLSHSAPIRLKIFPSNHTGDDVLTLMFDMYRFSHLYAFVCSLAFLCCMACIQYKTFPTVPSIVR